MENISNASSEEELLQLRNEGKISEVEYQDLLAAMRTPSPENVEEVPPAIDAARTKRKQGKIAFVLMFVGIIFPLLGWAGFGLGAFAAVGKKVEVSTKVNIKHGRSPGHPITAEDAAKRQKDIEQRAGQLRVASAGKCMWMYLTTVSCFALGVVFGIAAFVLGVISRPDTYGKATVTSIAAIAVIAILARLFVF